MKLCDNPTCTGHCEVKYTKGPYAVKEWRFAGGFRSCLSKEQLRHFNPELNFNVCGRCIGLYTIMSEKIRKIEQLIDSLNTQAQIK